MAVRSAPLVPPTALTVVSICACVVPDLNLRMTGTRLVDWGAVVAVAVALGATVAVFVTVLVGSAVPVAVALAAGATVPVGTDVEEDVATAVLMTVEEAGEVGRAVALE